MEKNKVILPISIIIGCVIIGGFIYASQLQKQESIERQQQVELRAKAEADESKAEKDLAEATFSNNLKCQTLLKDLKQKWDNVVGIYYDDLRNTCMVKYTENGETEEAPLETMEDN